MRAEYYWPEYNPRENEVVGDFISNLIWGQPKQLSQYCTMGVFSGGNLVAGTAYHNWHPDSGAIELSSASLTRKWLARPVVRAMFAHPFDILKARICVLRVSEHNAPMRAIARRFGFEETIIPRIRANDEAECVYTLSADDWTNHRMSR